jgi:murein hydrolase activator
VLLSAAAAHHVDQKLPKPIAKPAPVSPPIRIIYPAHWKGRAEGALPDAPPAAPAGNPPCDNAAAVHGRMSVSPECEPIKDLSNAVPLRDAVKLPNTAARYSALKREIESNQPAVTDARRKSKLLNAQADDLRSRLDETTGRVQALEEEKGRIDAQLARLIPQEREMSARFTKDRVAVARLLAVLERLQSDMPPVIALRADDALSAARGAMVLGNSLPRIYQAAAELATRLSALRSKRVELTARRQEGVRVGAQLSGARIELDQLLAIKAQEADEATAQYGDLEAQLGAAAEQAATLEALLGRVAALRAHPAGQGIVVVSAPNAGDRGNLRRGGLVKPTAGVAVPGGLEGVGGARAPGLTILAPGGADVVAPGDGEVLFAGSYHKTGKVLILELGGGYDLVLAGLDRVDVRPGDELLAGEPVGAMPQSSSKLYFELRENGKGVSPAPWIEVDLRKAKRS